MYSTGFVLSLKSKDLVKIKKNHPHTQPVPTIQNLTQTHNFCSSRIEFFAVSSSQNTQIRRKLIIFHRIPFKDAPVKHSTRQMWAIFLNYIIFCLHGIWLLFLYSLRSFQPFFGNNSLCYVCFAVLDVGRSINIDFRAAWNSLTWVVNVKIDTGWTE